MLQFYVSTTALALIAMNLISCSSGSSSDGPALPDGSNDASVDDSAVDVSTQDITTHDASVDDAANNDSTVDVSTQDTALQDVLADVSADVSMDVPEQLDSSGMDTATPDSQPADASDEDAPSSQAQAHAIMGAYHTCALRFNGELLCWGSNQYGQIGQGDDKEKAYYTPTVIPTLKEIEKFSVGTNFTCAKNQAGEVYCWGDNRKGQLGLGDTQAKHLSPKRLLTLQNVKHLAAGSSHSCVNTNTGELWCWGYNNKGCLGDGTETNRPSPVKVKDIPQVEQIALGVNHSCAITENGELWCWGMNDKYQLGLGDDQTRLKPSKVTLSGKAKRLSLGRNFGCVQTEDSTLFCWGSNEHGQLGLNSTEKHILTPTKVTTPSVVQHVSAGLNHTCYSDIAGKLYCTGFNASGQLGDGTKENCLTWKQIGLEAVQQLSMGWFSSCAVVKQADTLSLYVWGGNTYGQLGFGNTDSKLTPTELAGLGF